jgi:branched-chain amino acid transport system ATP-binding protein
MASDPGHLAAPVPDAMLELQSVSRFFGGLAAVRNLDMAIGRGSIHGLIGPNGAGKTTVFNLITGATPLSSGSIRMEGREIGHLAPHAINRLGVARTFQNIRLFKGISVFENVRTAGSWRSGYGWIHGLVQGYTFHLREAELHQRTSELLDEFGLAHRAKEPAGALPYGEQRRLEILRALATRPKLLLLDEPAAGLNASETDALMQLVERILEQYELTILVIEHDMRMVMELCDTITVLDLGERICEGDPAAVRNDPLVIQAYLGRGDTVDASDQ